MVIGVLMYVYESIQSCTQSPLLKFSTKKGIPLKFYDMIMMLFLLNQLSF